MITIKYAAEKYGIPYPTLKKACQRYQKTNGEKGLRSKKFRGGRDWMTTDKAVQDFKANEYSPADSVA